MSQVIIPSDVYSAILGLSRSRTPADTVGALLGTIEPLGNNEQLVVITGIAPLQGPNSSLALRDLKAAWDGLFGESTNSAKPLGWFYAEPAGGVFESRLDRTKVHAAFAPEAGLLLDLNPTSAKGKLQLYTGGKFVAQDFIEALPTEHDTPLINWPGVKAITPSALAPAAASAIAAAQPVQPAVQEAATALVAQTPAIDSAPTAPVEKTANTPSSSNPARPPVDTQQLARSIFGSGNASPDGMSDQGRATSAILSGPNSAPASGPAVTSLPDSFWTHSAAPADGSVSSSNTPTTRMPVSPELFSSNGKKPQAQTVVIPAVTTATPRRRRGSRRATRRLRMALGAIGGLVAVLLLFWAIGFFRFGDNPSNPPIVVPAMTATVPATLPVLAPPTATVAVAPSTAPTVAASATALIVAPLEPSATTQAAPSPSNTIAVAVLPTQTAAPVATTPASTATAEPTSTTAPTRTALPATATTASDNLTPGSTVEHTIQPGETLAAIAAQYDTTVVAILDRNNLANPDLIRPGDVLIIVVGAAGGATPQNTIAPTRTPVRATATRTAAVATATLLTTGSATSSELAATIPPVPPPTDTALVVPPTDTALVPPTASLVDAGITATSTPQPPTAVIVPPSNTPLPPTSTIIPTEPPTATPLPPTATATPLPPTATETPAPTDTPLPRRTNTPRPTGTPVPPTVAPVPTDTPLPATETPLPTDTPIPPTATETSAPTDTPVPTDTPAAAIN